MNSVTGSARVLVASGAAAPRLRTASEFGGNAANIYYRHNTRNWDVYTLYRQVDHDFRADLGFMTQSGFTYTETGGSYKWQRDSGWYNWISLYASYDYRRDRFNNPLHKAFTSRINYQGPFQSFLGAYGDPGHIT